nr:Chain C, Nonstructural protein 5/6 [Escherichia coli]7T8M_D Chain D, Nonstructural protein 5/6 [Escherichia coli]
GVTFQSAVKR